ncbi:transglutaminase TgpA family protein [Methylomonas sp. HW2-6]|uniref:transglutaminase TgpA family protein n=1 Tax=Methylomonas sp. HW2-6 TaxID=3376687 RepID=UPI004042BA87
MNGQPSSRLLWFISGSIGLITLPHAWHVPPLLIGFFGLAWLWRLLAISRPDWLPNRLALFGLTLAGIGLVYSQHRGIFGRDAGTALFVVALGLKLLEIQGKRDVYVIVYLAFIVAATQFLYEESILMALYIVLVCAVLLATLITQNSVSPQTVPALKTAAALILQSLPIAMVLFVLFPRLEAPRWSWLDADNQAKSGLSDTLEPGSIAELSLSPELVFRVKFDGDLPPPTQRYWRGPVYSLFDGSAWKAAPALFRAANPDQPVFSGKTYAYTLMMEPQKQNWVFALELPSTFSAGLRRNELYQLTTNKDPGDRAEYRISSTPVYNTGDINPAESRENLQLPGKPSEQIRNLIAQLRGGETSPEVLIANLMQHFHRENFRYTLNPEPMPEHPVDTFLFERRAGFCSHYATAFVYLLRAAEIPARVVGGYQGGRFNTLGGFLEIRQADAHAWAEVWLDGKGWVRFDPTAAIAPERIEQSVNVDLQIASGAVNFSPIQLDANTLTWLQRSRQLWQNVDYQWQRWVINYDTANQQALLQSLGIDDFVKLGYWLVLSVGGLGGVLAWRLLRPNRRRRDPVLLAYRQFCDKLRQAGVDFGPGDGPQTLAQRAKIARPDLADAIERIATVFIRLRYEPCTAAEDLQVLKALVRGLRV